MWGRLQRYGFWWRRPWLRRDVIEGPLEDARTVLAEQAPPGHSLLQETERVEEPEVSIAEAELAARLGDEAAEEGAQEAERAAAPAEWPQWEGATPEELEEVLEPAPPAPEASLHIEEELVEALLDEGVGFNSLNREAIEAEVAERAGKEEG